MYKAFMSSSFKSRGFVEVEGSTNAILDNLSKSKLILRSLRVCGIASCFLKSKIHCRNPSNDWFSRSIYLERKKILYSIWDWLNFTTYGIKIAFDNPCWT